MRGLTLTPGCPRHSPCWAPAHSLPSACPLSASSHGTSSGKPPRVAWDYSQLPVWLAPRGLFLPKTLSLFFRPRRKCGSSKKVYRRT